LGKFSLEKPHQERKGRLVRIRSVASRQASRPLLISLKVRRTLKRASGLHKLMSIVYRMGMKLESEFLDSLRIKAEALPMSQSSLNNELCFFLHRIMILMSSASRPAVALVD